MSGATNARLEGLNTFIQGLKRAAPGDTLPRVPRFSAIPADSDPAMESRRLELFRSMSPRRKVELVEDANRTARQLALAGIALRHPEATPEARRRLLFGLVLGEELATRVYGPAPFLVR